MADTTIRPSDGVAQLGDTEAADTLREVKSDLESPTARLKDTAQRAKEAVSEGLGTAKVKAREAADQTQAKVREGYAQARHGAERARETAHERYDELSGQMREGYVRVRRDVDDLADNVNTYVRQNPGKSVIIAAVVGFLTGLLMSGGRDS